MVELVVLFLALVINGLLFFRPMRAAARRLSGSGPAGWEGDR